MRDITDQKRAEDAIAEGRRLLQEVIDTVPAVINVKDKELRYILMNRYMAGIFGIEPSDAIGRTTTDLMSRYGAQKTDENDKRVLAAGRELGFYEEEYIDSSGDDAAMAGQQASAARRQGRDRKHRHRRARHRRAQARRTGDAQGQGCGRIGAAKLAGNPELADRGGKTRSARTAGGGRRPRGQQSGRHQPDRGVLAGAQDRAVCLGSRSRQPQAIEPERFSRDQPRRLVATGGQSQSRRRTDPVVQAGGGGPELFGSARLRPRRSHRAGGDEPAAGPAKAQSDPQRRVPAQSHHEQLSRDPTGRC